MPCTRCSCLSLCACIILTPPCAGICVCLSVCVFVCVCVCPPLDARAQVWDLEALLEPDVAGMFHASGACVQHLPAAHDNKAAHASVAQALGLSASLCPSLPPSLPPSLLADQSQHGNPPIHPSIHPPNGRQMHAKLETSLRWQQASAASCN
jgi:hypothetical protein